MKRSVASQVAFGFFIALPLLPAGSFVLGGSPVMVFSVGAAAYIFGVILICRLLAACSKPHDGLPPVAKHIRFSRGDLPSLAAFLIGTTIFIAAGFKCEAEERSSRPGPLPVVAFRQYFLGLESGMVCIALGGLISICPALKCSDKRRSTAVEGM